MKSKNVVGTIILATIIGLTGYGIYQTFFAAPEIKLYYTQKLDRRTIRQVIKATGYIHPVSTLKVGSIISGIIEKMFVEENELVKKGQIIALVDDGREDTEIKEALAAFNGAQARLSYKEKQFARQKALFADSLISRDAFEKITSEFESISYERDQKKAALEKARILFERKQIRAPEDGIILSKVASEGETVTVSSPPTVIYVIAKDLTKMEVELEIDENVVGSLRKGMQALLTFDAYPYQTFSSIIEDVRNAAITRRGAVSYNATAQIDNSQILFRPGMSVTAHIAIAEQENSVAVPGHIFRLNVTALKDAAKLLGYTVKELDTKTRHDLALQGNMKWLWVKKEKSFLEKPVEIGINDNAYFEIVSGLDGTEELIVDVAEPDAMKEFFEQFFGKGLKK